MAPKQVDNTIGEIDLSGKSDWKKGGRYHYGAEEVIARIKQRMKISKSNRGNMNLRGHGYDLRLLTQCYSQKDFIEAATKWTHDNCEKVSYISRGVHYIDWKLQTDARPIQDAQLMADMRADIVAKLKQVEKDLQGVTDSADLEILRKSTRPLCCAMRQVHAAQTKPSAVQSTKKRQLDDVTDAFTSLVNDGRNQTKRPRQGEAANERDDSEFWSDFDSSPLSSPPDSDLDSQESVDTTQTESVGRSESVDDLENLKNTNEPETLNDKEDSTIVNRCDEGNDVDNCGEARVRESEDQAGGLQASGDDPPISHKVSADVQTSNETTLAQQSGKETDTAQIIGDVVAEIKRRLDIEADLKEVLKSSRQKLATLEDTLKDSQKTTMKLVLSTMEPDSS